MIDEYDPSVVPEIDHIRRFIYIVREFTKANRIHLDEVLRWNDQDAEADFWKIHDSIEDHARIAEHNINIIQKEYSR